ncbi:MAG: endo-1,4-beta-xylanase [Clostridia bacterium]|nr:endo-1,4-beta-xylanase [Clostridia bacterium]
MKQDEEKVSKGIFVNYQIAEAITEILMSVDETGKKQFDLSTEDGLEGAKKLLEDLKKRWQEKDKIPGYNLPIGKNMVGMDDISIEEIIEISESLKQYDVYSCECAANMQYCMIRDNNGKIAFDFSALEKIAKLAELTGKKIVIDSAIVFGDHFPENMKTMNKSEIEEAIALYTRTLETNFGDYIDRIDVLNSVFQRKDVSNKEGISSEQFWINIFGEDYATDVLRIVRETLKNKDIKLCWNEFYITNENDPQRLLDFIQRIKETECLDVIGLQDKFRSDTSVEYIQDSLLKLVDLCNEKKLKLAITELGCGITRKDIELLNAAKNNGNYEETLQDVNKRIQTIVASVEEIAQQNSDTIISVEERYSDKFDYNNRDIKREHGHDVNTTGKSKTNKTLTLNQIGKGTTKEFSSNPEQASRAFEALKSGIRTQKEIKDGQTQGEE